VSEGNELYQQVILDHNRAPRNFRVVTDANRKAEGANPLCGDNVQVFLKVDGAGVIEDIGFTGSGCAISKASASMMTSALKGKTVADAERAFEAFHGMVTGKGGDPAALGKLAIFAGVAQYPARVKCASLAWHTLRAALADGATVTTE
jgi:nitrogen fixation NifU-like protein